MGGLLMKQVREILKGNVDIADFFINSENVLLLLIDHEEKIISCNECFKRLLQLIDVPLGKNISEFLMPESQSTFPLENKKSIIINFLNQIRLPVPVKCFALEVENGFTMIIGTKLMMTNDHILDQMTLMSNELSNMTRELNRKNRELEEAQANIKILSGIIPICMHCKEIRDDDGFWNKLEMFISKNSEAKFSHGICPDCMKKHYSEIMKSESS